MSLTSKQRITEDMKGALRAGDKQRLGAIRLMLAELKRVEVDERIELDDGRVTAILDKMVKQRRDSARQYEAGGRRDLADKENAEIAVIQEFLPAALSEAEIDTLVAGAIRESGATTMKDMGAVMNLLRPKLSGRADMGAVSQLVRQKLA